MNIAAFVNYFQFASIVIGTFTLMDFVFRFKRPLVFKICFSILLSSLLFLNGIIWMQFSFREILQLSPFINFGIWGGGLFTLSILTTGRIEKWVWICSLLILGLNIYNFFALSSKDLSHTESYIVFSLKIIDGFSVVNVVRFAQRGVLVVSIIRLFIAMYQSRNNKNYYQKKLIQWVSIILCCVLISIVLNNVITLLIADPSLQGNYLIATYSLFCLSFFILTFYRPYFLHNQDISKLNFRSKLQSDELTLTDANFFIPFFTNQYFLNKDANIEHFCREHSIKESDSFNEQIIKLYNMSFANLINKKRVEYFTQIASKSTYHNYSVEALAKESGFSSRTALYKPFKKFHGGTPIEFLNSIND